MVIFQDASGTEHQISGPESMRKAMGDSAGRNVIMTDESGRVVSMGQNMHQLEANGQIIKALRAGGDADADDKKIQSAGKSHDKMPKVKKVLLIKSHKHSPLLKLLGDL